MFSWEVSPDGMRRGTGLSGMQDEPETAILALGGPKLSGGTDACRVMTNV